MQYSQVESTKEGDITHLSVKVLLRRYLSVIVAGVVILIANVLVIFIAKPIFISPESEEVMTWQPYVVMNAVAISIFLMAIGLPADLILMAVSGAFCVFRIIDTNALLEGLSNSGVVAVAVLCVVSKAVDKTRALNGFMSVALGHPTSIAMAMVRMAVPVIGLGTVFNNTPLVAVMIPIVKNWTDKIGLEVSYFMMPLSFFSMLSACFTTMGSSTNLLAVDLVPKANIQFCDLTPVGFFVMATGVAYCALFAPYMLPSPSSHHKIDEGGSSHDAKQNEAESSETNDPERYTVRLELEEEGPLLSYTAAECRIKDCLPKPARIKCVRGAGERSVFKAGDQIELQNATADDISSILSVPGITFTSSWLGHRSSSHVDALTRTISEVHNISGTEPKQNWIRPVRKWIAANVNGGWKPHHRPLFEVVISPGGLKKYGRASFIQAQSLANVQTQFSDYNLTLIAFRGLDVDLSDEIRLGGGEVLLVEALVDLPATTTRAFRMALPVPEGTPPNDLRLSPLDPLRPVLAVLGLVSCVVLSAFRVVPLDSLALLVGLLSILVGTLTAKEFYGAINGPVLLTVAASFGLGTAFAKTGVASFLAETVLGVAEKGGPFTVLGSIVMLALTLGVVVSNNTTVILLAPLVEDICERKGLNLKMMMLAVIYAANLSFATPFSYQTNMMVMPHGGYVFMDYVKFGVPMMLMCGVVAIVGTQLYWGGS